MIRSLLLLSLVAACVLATACLADTTCDPVTVTATAAGQGKVVLELQAGPSGTPDGFAVWWMTRLDFLAAGGAWPSGQAPALDFATFNGTPTLNTEGGTITTFRLAPNEKLTVEVGDLVDETGLAANDVSELTPGEQYAITGFAVAGTGRSELSPTLVCSTRLAQECTFTIGFWKNHESAWPVTSLKLGTVTYTKAQLLSILGQPAGGNGLIALAHQLIATKLNLANGAAPATIAASVAAADALIGGLVPPPVGVSFLKPSLTSSLTEQLDDFNNEVEGPVSCGSTTAALPTSWGQLKTRYR